METKPCSNCKAKMIRKYSGGVLMSSPPQYPWSWWCGCGHHEDGGFASGRHHPTLQEQWENANKHPTHIYIGEINPDNVTCSIVNPIKQSLSVDAANNTDNVTVEYQPKYPTCTACGKPSDGGECSYTGSGRHTQQPNHMFAGCERTTIGSAAYLAPPKRLSPEELKEKYPEAQNTEQRHLLNYLDDATKTTGE